jgi:intraflagellar transport protein 172
LTWPTERDTELVIGLAEGKVKVGNLKTNKSQSLFGLEIFVVAVTHSPDGNNVAASYLDGSIITFNLETK